MMNIFGGGGNPIGQATGLDLGTPGNGSPMGGSGAINSANASIMTALMGSQNPSGQFTTNLSNPNINSTNPRGLMNPGDFLSNSLSLLGANPVVPLNFPTGNDGGGTQPIPAPPQQQALPPVQQPQQPQHGGRHQQQSAPAQTPGFTTSVPMGQINQMMSKGYTLTYPGGNGGWNGGQYGQPAGVWMNAPPGTPMTGGPIWPLNK